MSLCTLRAGSGWRWALGLATALAFASAGSGAAAQVGSTETSVKAAYLYKFLPYVEWPETVLPTAETAIVIGVVDAEPVRAELESLVADHRINGRALKVRRVTDSEGLEGVHVLFVGRASTLTTWLARLKQRPVLVVSDGPQGVDQGSMLSFVLANGRIRFEASQVAAERSSVKLSARLLAIADRVVVTR